jgi:hypothetical protein
MALWVPGFASVFPEGQGLKSPAGSQGPIRSRRPPRIEAVADRAVLAPREIARISKRVDMPILVGSKVAEKI